MACFHPAWPAAIAGSALGSDSAVRIGWALALQFSFERLISIDLMLYGASLILEFVALVVLRFREPSLARPFRAGNLAMAIAIGVMPTALIVYAAFAARDERMAHMPALLFGLIIAVAGPVFYKVSRSVWSGRPLQKELQPASSGD